MSDKCLFAFHVGPVQDFIAAARRTQDLWVGSWLLSYLSRAAFETAIEKGAEPVLPKELATERDEADADVSNHFTMRLPASRAEKIAQAVEKAVRDKWQEIESKTKGKFFDKVSDDLWQRQTNNLLEIYWVLVDDDGTVTSRNQAQVALDARKRLRNFEYVEEANLKCTLCGARQELSEQIRNEDARQWWQRKVKEHLTRDHLLKLRVKENGNERLCAVCAVKRAAVASQTAIPQLQKTDASFPSTSSVAAAIFKKQLREMEKAQSELTAHLQALNDLNLPAKVEEDCIPELARIIPNPVFRRLLAFDGDLFYAETFTVKRIKDEFPDAFERLRAKSEQEIAWSLGASSVDEALQNFGEEFQAMAEKDIPGKIADKIARADTTLRALYRAAGFRPSKYFAALMMDGDHMGSFFGKADEAQAQDLSERVSKFAREQAKQIVNENFGRLVYAGGDDVLALLPLANVLKCARELQEGFKEAVGDIQLPSGVDQPPTPSVGIAIAHHTAPLDLTLQTMQRAEKAAKNFYGRDALCVHILKRSGEEIRVGTHWTNDAKESLAALVEETIELLRDDVLSMKFAHTVANEARALNADAIPPEARISALKRLAKRQSGKHYDEARARKLAERLAQWSTTMRGAKGDEKPLGMEEVAQWILLARFIASGGRNEE